MPRKGQPDRCKNKEETINRSAPQPPVQVGAGTPRNLEMENRRIIIHSTNEPINLLTNRSIHHEPITDQPTSPEKIFPRPIGGWRTVYCEGQWRPFKRIPRRINLRNGAFSSQKTIRRVVLLPPFFSFKLPPAPKS